MTIEIPSTRPKLQAPLEYEVLIMGDRGAGKELFYLSATGQSLISYDPTLEDHSCPYIAVDGVYSRVCFNEMPREEYFAGQGDRLLQKCDGIIIVYDVCNKKSFEHVQTYWKTVKWTRGNSVKILILGSKCDGDRAVSTEEGRICAVNLETEFREFSAIEMAGVQEAVTDLMRSIRGRKEQEKLRLETEKVKLERKQGLQAKRKTGVLRKLFGS